MGDVGKNGFLGDFIEMGDFELWKLEVLSRSVRFFFGRCYLRLFYSFHGGLLCARNGLDFPLLEEQN